MAAESIFNLDCWCAANEASFWQRQADTAFDFSLDSARTDVNAGRLSPLFYLRSSVAQQLVHLIDKEENVRVHKLSAEIAFQTLEVQQTVLFSGSAGNSRCFRPDPSLVATRIYIVLLTACCTGLLSASQR